jgi:hypothetical protein
LKETLEKEKKKIEEKQKKRKKKRKKKKRKKNLKKEEDPKLPLLSNQPPQSTQSEEPQIKTSKLQPIFTATY